MVNCRIASLTVLVPFLVIADCYGQVPSLQILNSIGGVRTASVEGDRGYLVTDEGLSLFDLSDPLNPIEGPLLIEGLEIEKILVVDGIGYVGVFNAGLLTYDFKDANNPRLLGRFTDPIHDYRELSLSGNLLYLQERFNMKVVDVSDPSSPSLISSPSAFGEIRDFSVTGVTVYITTDVGIQVFDFTNPSAPVDLELHIMPSRAVSAFGDRIAVDVGSRVQVYDVSDPNNLVEVTTISRGAVIGDVQLLDNLVYVLDGIGLAVFDIGNPETPVPVGRKGITDFSADRFVSGSTARNIYTLRGTFVIWRYNGPLPDCPTCPREPVVPGECDSGYYLLDSYGGRHRIGNPAEIIGPVFFGRDIARDLEVARSSSSAKSIPFVENLAVLDGYGAVHLVAGSGNAIQQEFYFPESPGFPEGRAVDLQMSRDGQGFWVLTDYGGIYRAGSVKSATEPALVPGTDRMGVLGVDVPFGSMRNPGTPNPGGASLRAVSFAAMDLDRDSRAEAYILLDSQGGRFHLDPDGALIPEGSSTGQPENDPLRLIDPVGYIWPFFPGLDIARDLEVVDSLVGVVILDGWDGIHPVPVNIESNPVYFATNRVSNADTSPRSNVGMPYVRGGFDDPSTDTIDEGDPNVIGLDAASVFTDLEFTRCEGGLYTLDKFGGVFALGNAREDDLEVTAPFTGSPYFYPFLYAEDMEVFGSDETMFGSRGELMECETVFCNSELSLRNLFPGARPIRFVLIPAGTFLMGSPQDEPNRQSSEGSIHSVTIQQPFYISETEVTQAQWEAVMGPGPWEGQTAVLDHPDAPATYMNWTGAWSFTATLNSLGQGTYRLPTEAEWEYACRGGTQSPYWFGTSQGCDLFDFCAAVDPYLVYVANSAGLPDVVGTKLPNPFGLYNMLGNVSEWTLDPWHGSYEGAPTDGSAWLLPFSRGGEHTVRGGSFLNHLGESRSASRRSGLFDNRRIGFRIVREVD